MDDLSSVEWTAPKAAPTGQQYPQASGNYYPILRPTPPISGRSTPSTLQPTSKVPSNPPSRSNASTPANDSFANLVGFTASQSKGASLQEQQRKLQEEKAKQEAEKKRAFDSRFGAPQRSWDTLGDRRATSGKISSPPTYTATSEYGGQKLSQIINKPFAGIPAVSLSSAPRTPLEDEDDILAAFNASAPVDKSSHMPDLSMSSRVDPSNVIATVEIAGSASSLNGLNGRNVGYTEEQDDDPFGLGMNGVANQLRGSEIVDGAAGEDTEDDVLGLLGRPVSEFPKKPTTERVAPKIIQELYGHPQERAASELVDMGFAPDKARIALESTETGTDVQAAVGWLLNQAHEDARKKTKSQNQDDEPDRSTKTSQTRRAPGRRKSSTSGAAKPAWMKDEERSSGGPRRPDSKSPVNGEKDPAQYASEIGSKVFKTAGSLWKTGTQKLNQAVQEFNSDSDSSQPKWMRDTQPVPASRKPRAQQRETDVNDHDIKKRTPSTQTASASDSSVTNEALMLEADSRPSRKPRVTAEPSDSRSNIHREQSPAFAQYPREETLPIPKAMQQARPQHPKTKLSRQAVEEETGQAYISPARRKRPTPKPPVTEPEPDLLLGSTQTVTHTASSHPNPLPPKRTTPAASLPIRPSLPKRSFPSLSPFALQASTKERQAGNSAFKRGDYAQATTHYSSALSAVPSTHPLTIVLLTNRSLSNSKTGEPKASMADAKSALDLIGTTRGIGENIELGGDEGSKPMDSYWGKAMMRQAEASEHLERWADAAAIWRTCVEAGVGGATSIAGRNRSERAATPPSQSKPAVAKKATPRPRPKATALGDLAPDSESVTRLRAANAAADRLDDEKFALADVVDARVSRWRAGKEGNLRALLSTLENVLWGESGWKKVGMGDVLLPGKVKLVYMKGIAKVHPDKVIP